MTDFVHYLCKGCGKTATMKRTAFDWRCRKMSRPQYCGIQCMTTNLHTFLPRLDTSGGPDSCWDWQGRRCGKGYGIANFHNRPIWASRLSWILHNGVPEKGLHVCHRCDRPPCCNPSHLFLGSAAENNKDKQTKGRHAFGERAPGNILSYADVKEIRQALSSGQKGVRLAEKYGVSPVTISAIKVGRIWNSRGSDYSIFEKGM